MEAKCAVSVSFQKSFETSGRFLSDKMEIFSRFMKVLLTVVSEPTQIDLAEQHASATCVIIRKYDTWLPPPMASTAAAEEIQQTD